MKTVVQVFEPEQAESMSRRERQQAVEKALAYHASQLQELSGLMKELCSQDLDNEPVQVDFDLYMPALRVLIKERYDILDELENEYNRLDKMDHEVRPALVMAGRAVAHRRKGR